MTHPFQQKGLGQAPFQFVRYRRTNPKSKCDNCGIAIMHRYECRSADGRTFGVGSECVKKVEPSWSPLRQAMSAAKREAEAVELVERIQIAKKNLAEKPELLRLRRHPMGRVRESMRDYVEFVFENGRQSSLLRHVCKIVEDAVEGKADGQRKRRRRR